MMRRIFRWFRHLVSEDGVHTLPVTALARLQARIAESETTHTGEIRICIEAALPASYLLSRDPTSVLLRNRALALFASLGVWDTEHNNGVLIYLCLAERAIELIADRGIDNQVDQQRWNEIVLQLAGAIRSQQFEAGLDAAIEEIHTMLSHHFPIGAGQANPNELSDSPLLL